MTSVLLEVRDLAVEFNGKCVLEVDSLRIRQGERLALVGTNGAGKSTLMRVLGLTLRPTQGHVYFAGTRVDYRANHLLRFRRRMAAVLQEPLLCRMSVAKNVALGLRFHGIPSSERSRRVDHWIERLKIAHLRNRRARGLSGGEAQRTSLARALAIHPEILFLDEPFAALDPPTRDILLRDFKEILSDDQTTTIFATHHRGEALAMGTRVAVLLDGRIAQIGTPDEIFGRPESAEVARFVGVDTLIPGVIESRANGFADIAASGSRLRVQANGEDDLRPGSTVLVSVRPENVHLELGRTDPTQTENVLVGKVDQLVPTESHIRVVVDCGVKVSALISRLKLRNLGLERGSAVTVSFLPETAHLIRNHPTAVNAIASDVPEGGRMSHRSSK